ncbi:MAG: arginine repressor [Bacteroidota bacterium]
MDKHKRHLAIRKIVATTSIGSQEELVRALKHHGIRITQATLSRDLKNIGILRVPTRDGVQYTLPGEPVESELRSIVAREVLAVKSNELLIVINTFPGRAQGVARFLDSQQDPEILGTVAGDDTVIVLPRSVKRIKRSFKNIEEHFTL